MIPNTRPVIGKDLDVVRQQFGLLTSDACWLFGLSITRWMMVVRQAADLPVKDPTLALLVRFLDQHPELSVIPKFPSVAEMYEMVNSVYKTDQKRFSVLLGSEASATYRWLKTGSRQSPAVNRLMHYLKSAMLSREPNERDEMLQRWRETVSQEGAARGVPDIFKSGHWNVKGVAEASERISASIPESAKPKPKKGVAAKSAAAKAATKKAASK